MLNDLASNHKLLITGIFVLFLGVVLDLCGSDFAFLLVPVGVACMGFSPVVDYKKSSNRESNSESTILLDDLIEKNKILNNPDVDQYSSNTFDGTMLPNRELQNYSEEEILKIIRYVSEDESEYFNKSLALNEYIMHMVSRRNSLQELKEICLKEITVEDIKCACNVYNKLSYSKTRYLGEVTFDETMQSIGNKITQIKSDYLMLKDDEIYQMHIRDLFENEVKNLKPTFDEFKHSRTFRNETYLKFVSIVEQFMYEYNEETIDFIDKHLSKMRKKYDISFDTPKRASSNTDVSLDEIDAMDGRSFELFCSDLLSKNGYVKVEATPRSKDWGADVLAESKDGATYVIQCKRWQGNVGYSAIEEAIASKGIYRRQVAVVLTNSVFTQEAKDGAKELKVLLWDRDKLIDLMENAKDDHTK